MRILVMNGPNLNFLGKRDSQKYGNVTLGGINKELLKCAKKIGYELVFFQSNHEGSLIDFLQKEALNLDGIIINPGALVRYAYCLRAALIDTKLPVIEVHLSDINKTGIRKDVNVLDDVTFEKVMGLKEKSYYLALEKMINHLKGGKKWN